MTKQEALSRITPQEYDEEILSMLKMVDDTNELYDYVKN